METDDLIKTAYDDNLETLYNFHRNFFGMNVALVDNYLLELPQQIYQALKLNCQKCF